MTQYQPITLPGCEDMAASPKVHPAAAIFPMMSDAELDELAADIKANGLIHPIIRDASGQLIDGRNRLWACEIAGVEPRFETLAPDTDPIAFILSNNVKRRHMTKGQAAMAVVETMALGGKKLSTREAADSIDASHMRIVQASMVRQYAPDLVSGVLDGNEPLDKAYARAKERKAAASSTEARMAQLRLDAPDLADQIVEERLTLDEALAVLKERQKYDQQQRKTSTRLLMDVLTLLDTGAKSIAEWADELISKIDPDFFAPGETLTARRVTRASEALAAVAAQLGGETHNGTE